MKDKKKIKIAVAMRKTTTKEKNYWWYRMGNIDWMHCLLNCKIS